MKKSVKIAIVVILILALIAAGVVYLVLQTREDELLIGEERAAALALKDAGLTDSQVDRLKVKLKVDDGVWYYDVEFETIALEYDYEIEAYSGEILEKDIDD